MSELVTLPVDIKPSQVETGMTIRVHQKIKDVSPSGEEKERVQIYEGLVINLGGGPTAKTMTVRKIASGVGVEKIFPMLLPSIARIELVKKVKAKKKSIEYVRKSTKRMKEIKSVKLKTVA